jgi:hypothetical protein
MNGQEQKNIKDKNCPSDMAERYVNDLFELLEIKGQNSQMFTQICKLLMKYKIDVVQESWKDVVYSCDLPNGQIAGKLPPLWKIENMFQSHNVNKFKMKHNNNKQDIMQEGVVMKLFTLGKQLSTGEITEDEHSKLINQLIK